MNNSIDIDNISISYKFNSIFDLLDELPYDIKYKIYDEYIRLPYLTSLYFYEVKTYDSQRLKPKNLFSRVMKMKRIPKLFDYVRRNDKLFNDLYIKHYINNNKNFRNLNVDESFVLSILFSLYH
jgi:hypothetical protein